MVDIADPSVTKISRMAYEAQKAMPPGGVMAVDRLLATHCELIDCAFSFDGEKTPARSIMSPVVFLPVLALRVQEAGFRLLGADMGCVLRADKDSMFGARAVIPPVTGHIVDVIRGLFFQHYAAETFGLRKQALIEVAPLRDMLSSVFDEFETNSEGEFKWPQPSRLN